MITKPTVLILGAGASSGYGFPLGRGLRDLVCGIPGSDAEGLIELSNYDHDELSNFVDTLRRSAFTSVDWFLEEFPQFIPIGKAAIAATLIPFERPEILFPPQSPKQHWYELLVNTLVSPQHSFFDNQLSIVTFNYDRSLEHYLLETLTVRLGSEALAIDAIASLSIIHVHGTLGAFAPITTNGRPYSPDIGPDSIRMAAEQIIIVGQASGESEEFERARNKLREAERIVFLGFGFLPESVGRLEVFNRPWDEEDRQRVRVGGTVQGISDHRWQDIHDNVLNSAFPPTNKYGGTVLNYLELFEPLGL